ncbi:MAG: STAS domain-containing protein [Planctomycetota bacterium]
MDVTREQVDESVLLVISGQIDMYSSPELRGELKVALAGNPGRVVVDMEHVSFIDSSGLATLIEALQKMRQYRGQLRLCNLSAPVRGVFELSNLDQLFEIRSSREEALQDDAA